MALNSPSNYRKSFEMVGFCSVNVIVEAASTVSMALRKQITWFQCDRGSGFSSFNVTAEVASAVSMRPRNHYKNFNIIFLRQIGSFQHKTTVSAKKLAWPRKSVAILDTSLALLFKVVFSYNFARIFLLYVHKRCSVKVSSLLVSGCKSLHQMLYFCLSHSIQPKSTGNNFMTIKIDQK
jgi:hypothetical protein